MFSNLRKGIINLLIILLTDLLALDVIIREWRHKRQILKSKPRL